MENETNVTEETLEPQNKASKKQYFTAGAIIAIAVVVAGGLAWLYMGSLSSAKEKIFKAVPLPAALVDMQPVSAKSVIERIDLAKQLSTAQGSTTPVNNSDIFEQLLDVKKIETLANHRKLSVSQTDIDEEYQKIIKQYANGDEEGFKTELEKTYRMSPEEFKDEVIKQELLQSQLLIWYNQQKDLNKATYDTTAQLQKKLDDGQSFDDVAKQFTQDESTKDFAGDSGVIAFNDLLPEFRTALQDAKVGDIKMVVSRYGNHILKVLELNNDGQDGQKQIHLQQIFVKQVGFTDWLTSQSNNIRVIKLLKFN